VRTRRRPAAEPIEDYLDELMSCLRMPPRATRRLLAETEDHLRSAAEAAEQCGASRAEAERDAVLRFGSAARVAAQAGDARRAGPVAAAGVLLWSGVALIGVGLVAVGLSGILAAILNVIAGRRFVGALPQGYSAAPCHHFLVVQPHASTCAVAAVLENSHDAVALRLLAGLIGLALVGAAWWTRRYLSRDPSFQRLLAAALSVVATLSFAVAAVVLLGMSADTAVNYGSQGVGWYLSGGLVSLAGALLAGARSWHHLRLIRPWNHVLVIT
jgi:hypothetical protein